MRLSTFVLVLAAATIAAMTSSSPFDDDSTTTDDSASSAGYSTPPPSGPNALQVIDTCPAVLSAVYPSHPPLARTQTQDMVSPYGGYENDDEHGIWLTYFSRRYSIKRVKLNVEVEQWEVVCNSLKSCEPLESALTNGTPFSNDNKIKFKNAKKTCYESIERMGTGLPSAEDPHDPRCFDVACDPEGVDWKEEMGFVAAMFGVGIVVMVGVLLTEWLSDRPSPPASPAEPLNQ